MKSLVLVALGSSIFCFAACAWPAQPLGDPPLLAPDLLFEERDGLVVVEAEHFARQSRNELRAWYINSPWHTPSARPDPDPVMLADAAGAAYVEVLPDTFVTMADPIIVGENLALEPGTLAVLHYRIHFNTPGRYYIWSRIRSNDEEDNTMHAGIDGVWPPTARILQFPKLQKVWFWNNQVRAAVDPPAGEGTLAFLDVPTSGLHTVMFSMREDGHEFDRFLLTTNKDFPKPQGPGPDPSRPRQGNAPEPFTLPLPPSTTPAPRPAQQTLVPDNLLFEEVNGLVAVEAEHFCKQSHTLKRAWHLTTHALNPDLRPDPDPPHPDNASGGAYLEVLPDSRRNDQDLLIPGENFSDNPGELAVLHYAIHFNTPGRYYVWTRTYPIDGDDNTLHVGLDDAWPDSGKRLHAADLNRWGWTCRQRTTANKVFLDVPAPGPHTVLFSMREDGCEFDKFLLAADPDFTPADHGPAPRLRAGRLPAPFAPPAPPPPTPQP